MTELEKALVKIGDFLAICGAANLEIWERARTEKILDMVILGVECGEGRRKFLLI